jgi:serine/threonine protein kinase
MSSSTDEKASRSNLRQASAAALPQEPSSSSTGEDALGRTTHTISDTSVLRQPSRSLIRVRSWGNSNGTKSDAQHTRSPSVNVGTPSNSDTKSSSIAMRASPPEELLPRIHEDLVVDEDDAPTVNISRSPGTPPKKLWERHYRNFLSRKKEHAPPPSLPAIHAGTITTRAGELLIKKSISPSTNVSLARKAIASNAGNSSSNRKTPKLVEDNGEGSVRGGSFFGGVFRNHHSKDTSVAANSGQRQRARSTNDLDGTLRRGTDRGVYAPTSNAPATAVNANFGPKLPSEKSRHKSSLSSNNLDETIRRGAEKSYSPGSARVRKTSLLLSRQPETSSATPPDLTSSLTQNIALPTPSTTISLQPRLIAQRQDFSVHSSLMMASAIPPPRNTGSRMMRAQSDSVTEYLSHSPYAHIEDSALAPSPFETPPTLRHIRAVDLQSDTANNVIASSSAMKKAFTEFHNSADTGHDSAAAYLGEDTSFHGQGLFWPHTQRAHVNMNGNSGIRLVNSASHGTLVNHEANTRWTNAQGSLDTVHEDAVAIKSDARVLKAVQGVDVWQHGRRYLIAPAALAACPLSVMQTISSRQEPLTPGQGAVSESAFGTVLLGECLITYVDSPRHSTSQLWSTAVLQLRQNYLLEYAADSGTRGAPRGFAHLQLARCRVHENFHDALLLEFYASPCAKADARTLMIRLRDKSERDDWQTCLNRAANLAVHDLYDFREENALGKGQYAIVYAARRRQPSTSGDESSSSKSSGPKEEFHCALKVFDKTEFWRLVVKGRERADTIVREISVQATLTAKCRCIHSFSRLRGIFETSEHVVLDLELLGGLDLFQYISHKGVLMESEAAHILRDILVCLEGMNRVGLSHRDIKPANVLLCRNSGTNSGPRVKVCDFGMSTFCGVDGQVRGRCGTPGYVAPEIFLAGVHGGYGNKVDIFSAGVTLYVMLCGYEPFYGESDAELVEANKTANVEYPTDDWSAVSLEARDLVERMLKADPMKRPSAREALEHAWIQEHCTQNEQYCKNQSDFTVGDDASGEISQNSDASVLENACVIS